MSKLADQFRAMRIFNNWDMLKRFGAEMDVAIEYHRPPEGRAGWVEANRTDVWSPRPNPALEPPKGLKASYIRTFVGLRQQSLPAAKAWAIAEFGHDYVPSPFGGYLPKQVMARARLALTSTEGK